MQFPQVSLVLIAIGVAACDADWTAGPDAGMTALDRSMMQAAAGYKTFPKINASAYASSISGAGDINVYVFGDASDYSKIHPETSGTNLTLPVGTLIVREVLDAAGATSKLTLMAKGPSGFDPTLGDWWFGALDPQGNPLVVDGQMQLGALVDCHSCHIPRQTDDYLFGVPQADQAHR